MKAAMIALLAGFSASTALATPPMTIDFTTDDGGNVLVNGQDITSPPEFGNFMNLSASGPGNLGLAIFDSTIGGPNDPGNDPDLLVGLGNILILQDPNEPTQTVPGVFDTPDDTAFGGVMHFDFLSPTELSSVDLVDINGSTQDVMVVLTDSAGLTRTFDVPSHWTNDIDSQGPLGYDTLDLTTLAPQLGEGGATATATEDAGFDITQVVSASFDFMGSGALDNLVIVPAAPSGALLAIAGAGLLRRRR